MSDCNHINIVFCINKKYLPYISVIIASILKHSRKDNYFNFYVLSFDDLKKDLEGMEFSDYQNFKIFSRMVDRSIISAPAHHSYITVDARIRLFIPLILKDLDRCIYLDADVLVNKDITELYNINLENFYVAGVSDNIREFDYFLHSKRYTIIKRYGLKDEIYINSGVMLFNLRAIRDEHAANLLIDTFIKCSGDKDIDPFDQDCVNIAFNGKVKTIDPRWNVTVNSRYRAQIDCFILHWTGSHKPWNWPVIPAHKLYLENAKTSPYYESIRNNLLSSMDAYIAHYKKHEYIYINCLI